MESRDTGPSLGRSEKASHIVAREIVRDVVSRELEVGSRLPLEHEMLAHFGVSRGTLREALRVLETFGLIGLRSGSGGGPYVAGATSKDLGRVAALFFHTARATYRELAEARLALQPLAIRLAAGREVGDPGAKIREALETSGSVMLEDESAWTNSALSFHLAAAGSSGNRILDLVCQALEELWSDRMVGSVSTSGSEREGIREEHRLIFNAIDAKDPDTAERLMREHMEQWLANLTLRYPDLLEKTIDWV